MNLHYCGISAVKKELWAGYGHSNVYDSVLDNTVKYWLRIIHVYFVLKSNGIHPKLYMISILCPLGIMRIDCGEKIENLQMDAKSREAMRLIN